jgi:hypothetical protein
MGTREPKQLDEILKILRDARKELEEAIAAEEPITEGIEYHR